MLTYQIHHRFLVLLTTYCQCDEQDLSHWPSWTTLEIEPTVAWAPTCQCLGGDVLSLFCLCIAPGWLDWQRFCSSKGFSPRTLRLF
ncbi:hypothetical protein B0H10DRAFT_2079008 [Mycena sp. CBHHK59/15]|nr:hypothetical protein B0H10DRAFT_2079008 [Mycena sp. CBHHK59/15]